MSCDTLLLLHRYHTRISKFITRRTWAAIVVYSLFSLANRTEGTFRCTMKMRIEIENGVDENRNGTESYQEEMWFQFHIIKFIIQVISHKFKISITVNRTH